MWKLFLVLAFVILKYAALVVAQHPGYFWNSPAQPQPSSWNAPQRIHDGMCTGRMDGIVFPDPDNCEAFVQCQQGAVTRMRCQPGTLFDLDLFYCVTASGFECGSRRQPAIINTNPNERPPTSESHHSVSEHFRETRNGNHWKRYFKVCRGKQNGELIANPSNCRAYIECQQNLRLDRECEKGELFESRGGVCLSDFAVDCGGRNIPSDVDDATLRNVRLSFCE